jgi:hypothetical protein
MNIQLGTGVQLLFSTHGPQANFFGYYDKSPLDSTGRRLLCHRTSFDGRLVGQQDCAELGYWDTTTGTFHRITDTNAFNWQQGAMLQWLGPDFSRRVVFNERKSNKYTSVAIDVETGERCELPATIYSVDSMGHYAVTPRFERLEFCRAGYNYLGIRDERWNGRTPEGDGVILVDLHCGESRLIITIDELLKNNPLPSMAEGNHYVEHMLFNPSGNRFAFMHRWWLSDGGTFTRQYTCDTDGGNLFLFPDTGAYSHGCWRNDDEYIVYGRPATAVSKLRYSPGLVRSLVRPALAIFRKLSSVRGASWTHRALMRDGYLRFQDQGQLTGIVGKGQFWDNGHPNMRPNDDAWMLTDTYPDPNGVQHLLAYNLAEDRLVRLGSLETSYERTGYRADLHPRWDRSGDRVVVDSLADGSRQMYVFDVSEALISSKQTHAA